MVGEIRVPFHIPSHRSPGTAPFALQTPPAPVIDSQKKIPPCWDIVRRILLRCSSLSASFTPQTPAVATGLMPDIEPQSFFPDAPSAPNGCGSNARPHQPPAAAPGSPWVALPAGAQTPEDVRRNAIPAHGCVAGGERGPVCWIVIQHERGRRAWGWTGVLDCDPARAWGWTGALDCDRA
jgi:hypothetical protein